MESTPEGNPPVPPPLPAKRGRRLPRFIAALFISMVSLHLLLKVTLTTTRIVKAIYAENGQELPLLTVQAMALVEGTLRFGRLYLGVTPLLIAAGFLWLDSRPAARNAYVALLVAGALFIALAIMLCLTYPLLNASAGP